MRIDANQTITVKTETVDTLKNLEAGDTLKGRVVEANENSMVIRTANGQLVTATLQDELPKGTGILKGAFVELIVKGISDGKILAELKDSGRITDLDAKISELLKQMNLPVEEKNIEAAKLLIKYNLPVDKDTLVNITGLKKGIDNLSQDGEGKVGLLLSGLDIKNTPVDVLNKIVLNWSAGLVEQQPEAETVLQAAETQNVVQQEEAAGEQAEKMVTIKAETGEEKSDTAVIEKKLVNPERMDNDVQPRAKSSDGSEAALEKPQAIQAKADSSSLKANNSGGELVELLNKLGIETGSEINKFAGQVENILASIRNADMETLTYLASKEIEATPKNIGMLIKNIENADGIAQFLDKLQRKLEAEQNPKLTEIKEAIKKVFLEPRQLEDNKEVTEQLKDIARLGEKLESYLDGSGNKDPEIREALSNLRDSIDFIKNINQQNNFLQLPIMINGDASTAKLYIFNEGKKSKAINPENATILLALDLKALGHLESMIGVKEKTVNVTFRVEDKHIGSLLESNSKKLKDSLAAKGYSLSPVRVISLGQPFSLLSMEALINERGAGKIHFDMRV